MIKSPNMILIDHILQLGIKDTSYYGTDIDAVIDDVGTAYQDAIKRYYDNGCRYLQIADTSWTYMIDEKFNEKVASLGYKKEDILEWFRRGSTKALGNRPERMTIANHFCKGNFKGHPLFTGLYDSVAPIIRKIPYDGFLIEYDEDVLVRSKLG